MLLGVGILHELIAGLARLGTSPKMPVAIIERGFAHNQRSTLCNLTTASAVASAAGVRSPAVVVIGEVVRLALQGDDAATALLREVGVDVRIADCLRARGGGN